MNNRRAGDHQHTKSTKKRRSWTIILVPPRPDARTRQLSISARSVAGIGSLALTLVAVAATWTGETTNIAEATADRLAESQRTVVSLLDSVHVLGVLAADAKASRLPPHDMIMPVAGRISSGFAASRFHPLLEIFRAHKGVDVSAPAGTRIVAPAAGRVTYVGWRFGYGLTVEIQHSGDVLTRYAHCRTSRVHVGDQVVAGQEIATVGSSGLATGPHVHFEVIAKGNSVDPIKFLALSRDPVAVEKIYGQGGN
jgi:murein DD-endopeptidase MepM/ murein hydrolase activator NlpD